MDNISEYLISDTEINENNVKSAPDQLAAEGETSPRDVKHIFDKLPELIAQRFNSFAAAVKESFAQCYTKNETDSMYSQLDSAVQAKADAENVYTKDETYSKDEFEEAIKARIPESNNGDMYTGTYDSNNDGVVNAAEYADTAASAHNGMFLYTHTAGAVTGNGTHGYFKATVTETLTSVNVNGTAHAVKCGDESQVELASGSWYSFIIDEEAATINFKAGGGVSSSKLASATATASRVYKGYTFYAGNKTLKTGTMDIGGATATAAKVLKGYTFYAGSNTVKTGTMETSSPYTTKFVTKTSTITGLVSGKVYAIITACSQGGTLAIKSGGTVLQALKSGSGGYDDTKLSVIIIRATATSVEVSGQDLYYGALGWLRLN